MAKGYKTGGRGKGTLNKTTSDLRKKIIKIVVNELQNCSRLMDSLTPKERLEIIIKLASFVVPKPVCKDIEDIPAYEPLSVFEEISRQILGCNIPKE
jgi:hypothetical protein